LESWSLGFSWLLLAGQKLSRITVFREIWVLLEIMTCTFRHTTTNLRMPEDILEHR
jgi:hypothetical protein